MTATPEAGIATCAGCLLPETMPGTDIGADGLCAECRTAPPPDAVQADRAALRTEMERVIEARRGARPYDAIVAFSGGKDSSYTLKMLVEDYDLRCLAITIDNGFLGGGTVENCKAVCGALGVDHMLFTPSTSFTAGMYRSSAEDESLHAPAAIRRASAICSSCISLINTYMLQQAIQLGVPIVAGGYIGGQVPRDGAVMKIKPGRQARIRTAMVDRFAKRLGEQARGYFELPHRAEDGDREISVINPMLGIVISEDAIIQAISALGWRRPNDTGVTSTNCRLNDLGVFIHTQRHGFHPYALEIAEQVRAGTLTREEARAKLTTLPSRDQVVPLARKIGLGDDAY